MKLLQHHIEWLERNDGKYDITSDYSIWYTTEGEPIKNVMSVSFNNTRFPFNPDGLSGAIDTILDAYPNS